ncbi:hypothetical protein Btru_063977 [Bulinus truncatus]|nr:hypothetical protein Btru_063977 [Bulinus truncatus]
MALRAVEFKGDGVVCSGIKSAEPTVKKFKQSRLDFDAPKTISAQQSVTTTKMTIIEKVKEVLKREKMKDYTIVDVPGDGNCVFTCLARQIRRQDKVRNEDLWSPANQDPHTPTNIQKGFALDWSLTQEASRRHYENGSAVESPRTEKGWQHKDCLEKVL